MREHGLFAIMNPVLTFRGKVPKRPKGADSKSARRREACVGSNPTLSVLKHNSEQEVFCIMQEAFFVVIFF